MRTKKHIVKCQIVRSNEDNTFDSLGFVIGTVEYVESLTDPTEDLVPVCQFLEFSSADALKELLKG